MAEDTLIAEWFESFGSSAVHPRTVISYAIETNRNLFLGIIDAANIDPEHPHPDVLRAWLSKNENRFIPLQSGGKKYRFERVGRRWRLIPIPPMEVAA